MADFDSPEPSPLPPLQKRLSLLVTTQDDDRKGPASPTSVKTYRKTKIVCTLGPKSNTVEKIMELLEAGMNVARFNFSHGTHEAQAQTVANVREAIRRSGRTCALLLDTKGPEIRTGMLENDQPVALVAGQEIDVVTTVPPDFRGNAQCIAVDYKNLPLVTRVGGKIRIADGLINLTITEIKSDLTGVKARVDNSATIGQRKNANLPGANVDMAFLSEKDKLDLGFAVKHSMDFIAASFTRHEDDVKAIRTVLGEAGKNIKIIAKIENQQGLDNFDGILAAADGVMVARGDLGVEIPIQRVCLAQKMMIRKCNLAGKPVITATQMLESMISNPRPTRAETTDIANAVFDGTDCVMLSGETANGEYPVESVGVMSRVCMTAEAAIDYPAVFLSLLQSLEKTKGRLISRPEAITSSAVKACMDLKASCIIVLTETGSSALFVAKYKPGVPVLTLTANEQTFRHCLVSRSLYPVLLPNHSYANAFSRGVEMGKSLGWIQSGDYVVLVSGNTHGVPGSTDTLKIVTAD